MAHTDRHRNQEIQEFDNEGNPRDTYDPESNPFSIGGIQYKPIVNYQKDVILGAHPELASQFLQDPTTGCWGIPQEVADQYGASLLPWYGEKNFLQKVMNPIGSTFWVAVVTLRVPLPRRNEKSYSP